eukprot:NODE_352_length_10276_cov_0.244178.p2 type:complete len:458 gc:universal NODE_352_length_10276_cov_0.244178:4847-6220(+)
MKLTDELLNLVNQYKDHGYIWFYENVFMKDQMSTIKILIPFLPTKALVNGELNPLYTEFNYLSVLLQLACDKMQRYRQPNYLNIHNVCELLEKSNKILVLSGAGISVSAGIPDFRSANGLYSQLLKEYPELSEPQEMFDLNVFKENPNIFYSFAYKIYPSNFKPTISHKFIHELEKKNKLLRNYTQNIDGLETIQGIKNVIQCHGSFEYAYCIKCNERFKGSEIEEEIFNKVVPLCKKCPLTEDSPAVVKPCITFFHEKLPKTFDDAIEKDVNDCDLVIVMGSSLKVAPVAEIVHLIDSKVPQLLINREVLDHLTGHFDIHLLGDCDIILQELSRRLNWNIDQESFKMQSHEFFEPHCFLFENGVLEKPVDIETSDEDSEDTDQGNNASEENDGLDEDELAGLYKDAEDIVEGTSERIKYSNTIEVEIDEESADDVDFNPYKKIKLEDSVALANKQL